MNLKENTTYMKIPCFKWLKLVDSIPERWKFFTKENYENAINLIIHDHHSIKGSRVITLDKLTSTKIYSLLISKVQNKPYSKIISKICLMTIISTGEQSICYHTLLQITPICYFSVQNLKQCPIS